MNLQKHFKIQLPIGDETGRFWNGWPGEYSNIPYRLSYTQRFGLTAYARNTGIYGRLTDGTLRGHNGHDFAGFFGTPLVFPIRAYVTFKAYDPRGYGWFVFFETETVTENGETFKMEFVLAHMREEPIVELYKWYDAGFTVGYMGSTGMSSGPHTHFGGRPLIRKADGNFTLMFQNDYRGYIDLTDFFIKKPVYDKQLIINLMDNLDTKLVRNADTGEFGWFYNKKLRVLPTNSDRATLLVLSYLHRKDQQPTIPQEEWDKLDKELF